MKFKTIIVWVISFLGYSKYAVCTEQPQNMFSFFYQGHENFASSVYKFSSYL